MTDFAHWLRLDGTTPATVWALVIAQTLLIAGGVAALARKRRRNGDTRTRQETLLLVVGLAFSAVVLVAFAIGTYEGATAFAADQLGWSDWRQIIPWASLDAASIGFSLFSIRAVMRDRSPRPARRIVYLTASFSAALQLTQGGAQHSWKAGAFLAFLALIGYKVLDTVVEQLRDAEQDETLHLKSPAFGLRWVTYLPNTLCAWLAWQNHPPVEGTRPTVLNAVANLERVRAGKLAALLARPTAPRWAVIAPRRYARQIRAAHAEATAAVAELTGLLAAEQAARADEHTASEQVRAERVLLGEQVREQAARADAEHTALERAEHTARTLRAELGQVREQATEHIRRADTEQERRTVAEQEAERLRSRLASAARGSAAPKQSSPSRPATSANTLDGDTDVTLPDDEIADLLWEEHRASMASTGKPLTRYRVQNGGNYKCWPRQADRVLDVLASRWAEHTGAHGQPASEHTGEQRTEQVGRVDPDDQEDSSVEATG